MKLNGKYNIFCRYYIVLCLLFKFLLFVLIDCVYWKFRVNCLKKKYNFYLSLYDNF